ncbi:cell division control protein Cdc6 [Candidatus Pacearchaeota archaeon]|nr:cell division control protein Cdc6 [Candidatus Pacearchaeota archaeon]|tara:strand:+ start:12742 stop:13989 length:1248 start_codon:yes stop_codon:yes gene_type:complete
MGDVVGSKIDKIFDSFIENNLFKDKFVLQTNYTPETIPHRDQQIEQIASILAPALRGERTSNLFVYGKTGTGKTLSVQCVRNELLKRNSGENNLIIEYINCKLKKVSDTEYRILAELIKKLGSSVPATGLPTDQVYNKFIELIDDSKKLIIIIFDEIDHAVNKISDNFLYNLTRLNSELKNSQISIVGISNNLTFLDDLDPRVKSSLSEEDLVFPPYNALQLQDILKERAEQAFNKSVLKDGVIQKCAAFAAREHGDARRALDLLRIAGELAERSNSKIISLKDIDLANEKIEKDKILDIVRTEPKQFQLVLLSILNLIEKKSMQGSSEKISGVQDDIFTGDVFNTYQYFCEKTRNDILTQRRVSDILSEFDMMGIINSSVVSKGRQGRTRKIKNSIPKQLLPKVKNILHEALNI